ncbi:peptidase S41 [Spirochaetia bacterium]|nr:peptidase S41 [Spirochaetia bacterium]
MNNRNFPSAGLPLSLVWLVSTVLLCAAFIFAAAPRVDAQGREQEKTQSTAQGQTIPLINTRDSRHYLSIIQRVFDFVQRNYVEEVDPKILYEGAMTGMMNALGDPYTSFLPETEMSSLNHTTQGTFGGVGLYISKPIGERADGKPPYVEVASPIEDTPGWRAGINPGDLIISIDGEPTDVLSMDDVLARLRGEPGVELKLLIRRGANLEFTVALKRAIIEVPTTKAAMIDDIGYLKLLTFTPMTVDRARDALKDFEGKKYKSLIIDLRNNYGGLLNAAVGISDLFLDGGVVVSTKSRLASENNVFNARSRNTIPKEIPIVVLINRGSASASEIVAGALKDRGRAYLVGEKSYGKGSVQQVYPLDENRSGFKITTARYYTPSDVNIDKIGIPPDREVKFPEFSAEDSEKLNSLIQSNKIPAFVEANPQAAAAQVDTFARQLQGEYKLDLSLVRRLVKNELNRTSLAPVYDLEYDVQLQEAVNILRGGNYTNLMKTAKTLKTLQEESDRADQTLAS